jgi:excisionase family DNA binding protein
MMTAQTLADRPPTREEMQQAATAIDALSGALSNDNALSLEVDVAKGAIHLELPPAIGQAVLELLTHIARGEMVTVVPYSAVLTTQEAADLLNVSRPFLTRLLDAGEIPHHRVGTHRRIRAEDLHTYKEQRDGKRGRALRELQRLGQEFDAIP